VSRWEHEDYLDAVEARLDREPERMRARRCTAEHPFGTLKSWMGHTHFLMKTKWHVSTEMSLHVLAYNLKRTINIVGAAIDRGYPCVASFCRPYSGPVGSLVAICRVQDSNSRTAADNVTRLLERDTPA